MQKNYLNYLLKDLNPNVQRTSNNKFIITHRRLPKLKIEDDTLDNAVSTFKAYIKKELVSASLEEIDYLFQIYC